jgi:hypothetical protein
MKSPTRADIHFGCNGKVVMFAWSKAEVKPSNWNVLPRKAAIRNTCPASEHDPDARDEGEVTKKLKGVQLRGDPACVWRPSVAPEETHAPGTSTV